MDYRLTEIGPTGYYRVKPELKEKLGEIASVELLQYIGELENTIYEMNVYFWKDVDLKKEVWYDKK